MWKCSYLVFFFLRSLRAFVNQWARFMFDATCHCVTIGARYKEQQKTTRASNSANSSYFLCHQVSKACTSICQWVRAMHKYHFVAKAVAPKRVNVVFQHVLKHWVLFVLVPSIICCRIFVHARWKKVWFAWDLLFWCWFLILDNLCFVQSFIWECIFRSIIKLIF